MCVKVNRGLRGERGFTEGNKGNKDGQNHEAEMLRYRDAEMEKRTGEEQTANGR